MVRLPTEAPLFAGAVQIEAQYASTCSRCFGKIWPGDVLTKINGEWVAPCCAPEVANELEPELAPAKDEAPNVMPRGKTARDACTKCFIIHANGQTDCE